LDAASGLAIADDLVISNGVSQRESNLSIYVADDAAVYCKFSALVRLKRRLDPFQAPFCVPLKIFFLKNEEFTENIIGDGNNDLGDEFGDFVVHTAEGHS
jgi:hypothetical protein